MISSPIKRLGLLAAFVSLSACSLALNNSFQQIKIDRAINSPTLAVKYNGVHASLIELRLNGESFGTRTMDDAASNGETTFTINVLSLKDGDNDVEIRLYNKDGQVVGSEKTTITTDSDTKGPVFLTTPKIGDNVMGPCEITVGFGRDFKNTYVSFFIDNQFKSMMNFPPYTYVWDTTRETNGWHEVEAWVVDDTSSTYKTRKVRVFVNNPGGHTYRPTPTPTAPAKAIKSAKLPALPDPSIDLTLSTNKVESTSLAPEAPIKSMIHAVSAVSAAKTTAIAPTIVGITITNPVVPQLEGHSSGVKPALMPQSTSVGPRLMTPTGKRTVATKALVAQTAATKPAPAKPAPVVPQAKVVIVVSAPVQANQTVTSNPVAPAVTETNATAKPVPPPQSQPSQTVAAPTAPQAVAVPVAAPAPVSSVPDTRTLVALVPVSKPEAPATTFHPLHMDVSGGGMMSKPTASATEPTAPVVPPVANPASETSSAMNSMGSTDSVIKPVVRYPNKPGTVKTLGKRIIPIEYGMRLPITADYSILLDGSPVIFDVKPSIHAGVPVTPFRGLIEKSGGQINWLPEGHEVTATTDGRDIWLKIGDRYAKINDEAIKLELAPFIESGRTIVPLSFIRSALNVDVDYDKVTGHVLITTKK